MKPGIIKGVYIDKDHSKMKNKIKPVFLKYLSTYVNLRIFRYINKNSNGDIENALKIVGLEKFKKTKLSKYTPEMKVKINIAENLILNISPIELIEPIRGLDYQGKIAIKNLINEVSVQENKDFIVYSSDEEELKFICNVIKPLN